MEGSRELECGFSGEDLTVAQKRQSQVKRPGLLTLVLGILL